MSPLTLFGALLVGHALGDYPLQGDFLARAKNHLAPLPGVPWYQALTAHAVIQAGIVALITGSPLLGLAEFAVHWLTDFGKSAGWYGFNRDQWFHVTAKAAWVGCALSMGLAR